MVIKDLAFSSLDGIDHISYLDYLFNPCSLVNIQFSISTKEFREIFSNPSRDQVIRISFPLINVFVTGEIVSFQAAADQAASYSVSALVLPVGVAHAVTSGIRGDLTAVAKTTSGTFSPVSWGSQILSPSAEHDLKNESLISSIMRYRRAVAMDEYNRYAIKAKTAKLAHRLVYVPMLYAKAPKSFVGGDVHQYLAGDHDFAASSSPVKKMGDVLREVTDNVNISFSVGSQGLMNAAFAYVAATSLTYQNLIGLYMGQTYTINIDGKVPNGLASILCSGAKVRGSFDWFLFRPYSFDGKFAPPLWGSGAALHYRTMYTFNRQSEGAADFGHHLSLQFGRFDPNASPVRS